MDDIVSILNVSHEDSLEKSSEYDGYYFTIRYKKNGNLHRLNGPAYENQNHDVSEWYCEGKLHRYGGPAVIDGSLKEKHWYLNGNSILSPPWEDPEW